MRTVMWWAPVAFLNLSFLVGVGEVDWGRGMALEEDDEVVVVVEVVVLAGVFSQGGTRAFAKGFSKGFIALQER